MQMQINWNVVTQKYPKIESVPASGSPGKFPMCLALRPSDLEIAVPLRAETIMGAVDDYELYATIVHDYFGRPIYITTHFRHLDGSISNPPFFLV